MQGNYKIEIHRNVAKTFKTLDNKLKSQIKKAILALAFNPRPDSCESLKGYPNLYRIRVRDYRIVYEIKDDKLLVTVVEVDSRGGIYDQLKRRRL
ncbi:MAG: type II toxin-antitoxin system RelE/ParE family toxin [Phycisphaerae bacterium]|nr:type II toxin-antitoxin system RelE/ParE family toxin [Phycisphaerae bacterium]